MTHALNAAHHAAPWSVALVGNPNCGKTALFNLLTGARQKVANYAGVTVERKAGTLRLANGQSVTVVDLPGAYSLTPATPDEQITLEVIEGRRHGEAAPDAIVAVVDATNLRMNLRLVLELIRLDRPLMVALNMADVARSQGLAIDVARLSKELGVPVVETVAVRRDGHAGLLELLQRRLGDVQPAAPGAASLPEARSSADLQAEVRRIMALVAPKPAQVQRFQHRIDAVVMHPVWGLALLSAVLFLMFQAVFSWANVPMDAIKAAMAGLGDWTTAHMATGPLRSLLVDGVIAGAGSVLVFLPQILILFFFILLLEGTGYMVRAAFLMDRLMHSVGLSGRAFIPLLSSFACAVPGIMATRTIEDPKDRLTTILVAPLMTCSARLPVYTLIIAAFIPNSRVAWGVGLQGLVMFGLYICGIAGALLAALILRRGVLKGGGGGFMMELPKYQWPPLKDVAIGLLTRVEIFLKRAGTIILGTTIVLWALASIPQAGPGQKQTEVSIAGKIGRGIEAVVSPIGFNRDISMALLPAMAAREVSVAAIATVYSIDSPDEQAGATKLEDKLQHRWSLATALAFLAWFVFAPQCISTIAVTRRETNGWKWPLFMVSYLFVLAYVAAGATYWTAVALGL
jgi:ferrous iron transport protein B